MHITSKRPDGYHNLQTIFQLLDYYDEITFRLRSDGAINRFYGNESISPEQDLLLQSANILKKTQWNGSWNRYRYQIKKYL